MGTVPFMHLFLSVLAEKFFLFMIEHLHLTTLYYEDDLHPPDVPQHQEFLWHLELDEIANHQLNAPPCGGTATLATKLRS